MFKAIWDLWRHPSRAPPLLTSFTRLVHATKALSGVFEQGPFKKVQDNIPTKSSTPGPWELGAFELTLETRACLFQTRPFLFLHTAR